MRNIYFLTVLLIISGCRKSPELEQQSEKIPDLESMKNELTYLKEVEWPKAYREQDTLLLDRILGDDFQMVDNSGLWFNKNDELEWIKAHATTYDSFYYKIKRLEILENGTAIIGGTGHIFTDGTESIYQSNNVLLKRGEIWKAVLSHVSGFSKVE